MNSGTRSRLLETASTLFAEHGYRGASVRRICDLARANPGAVSYHFGGKKQLYRAVLRRAASTLAAIGGTDDSGADGSSDPLEPSEVIDTMLTRLDDHGTEMRLLLRDIADGGEVAVEALEPTIRSALESLRLAVGEETAPWGPAGGRELFLDLAAPLFLFTAAWPVLQRPLDLEPDHRRALLRAAYRRVLDSHGLGADGG